jgi:saccharopine dehydrogenase (NAD+, L-lysine-forming)
MNRIGIRKEEKAFEARVPLMPDQVKLLRDRYHIDFLVEPNKQRALSDDEYRKVGAAVVSLKGSGAQVVLGIKEMPIGFFERDVVYVFFSHTIKGQKYNMAMLQNILDTGATLIDYERVIDEKGRRLIFFGNWAGMAGISDTFHILGQRLEVDRVNPNPFAGMKSTLELKTLGAVKEEFKLLGERITEQGLPKELIPFVIGFAGYGNVSRGAQEIFDILPHEVVQPEDLPTLKPRENVLYKCVFKEEHIVKRSDSSEEFDLQDYYKTGKSNYTGVFHNYVPYLTVLMNCIYWAEKYPRLVSKDFIKRHWKEKDRRLRVIGDISCDIGGAIEFTARCTTPGNPAFTYIIDEDRAELGVKGRGPVVMAVDNLPCELPQESSRSFGETLLRFIPIFASADFTVASFDELDLPREIKDAVIVYRGKLTKNYDYLKEYLQEEKTK